MQRIVKQIDMIVLSLLVLMLTPRIGLADHLNGSYAGQVDGDRINLRLVQKQNLLSGELNSQSGEKLTLTGDVDAEGIGTLSIQSTNAAWQDVKLQVGLSDQKNLDLFFLRPDPFFNSLVPVSQSSLVRVANTPLHSHKKKPIDNIQKPAQKSPRVAIAAGGNWIQTPGVIARMKVPSSWTHEYLEDNDVIILKHDDRNNAITIDTSLKAISPAATLRKVINENVSGLVKSDQIAGYDAAYALAKQAGKGEIFSVLLNKNDISVFALVVSAKDTSKARSQLDGILASMEFTAPKQPRNMARNYLERHAYSSNYGNDPMRVGSQTRLAFHANGSLSSNWRMAGGNSISYLDGNQHLTGGRWEVRGTRLLLRRPGNDSAFNYRYSVVKEGLALYDTKGEVTYLIGR